MRNFSLECALEADSVMHNMTSKQRVPKRMASAEACRKSLSLTAVSAANRAPASPSHTPLCYYAPHLA